MKLFCSPGCSFSHYAFCSPCQLSKVLFPHAKRISNFGVWSPGHPSILSIKEKAGVRFSDVVVVLHFVLTWTFKAIWSTEKPTIWGWILQTSKSGSKSVLTKAYKARKQSKKMHIGTEIEFWVFMSDDLGSATNESEEARTTLGYSRWKVGFMKLAQTFVYNFTIEMKILGNLN